MASWERIHRNVRVTSRCDQSWEPVEPGDNRAFDLARRNLAGPADYHRYAEPALKRGSFASGEGASLGLNYNHAVTCLLGNLNKKFPTPLDVAKHLGTTLGMTTLNPEDNVWRDHAHQESSLHDFPNPLSNQATDPSARAALARCAGD
jgi:hypothetical protein